MDAEQPTPPERQPDDRPRSPYSRYRTQEDIATGAPASGRRKWLLIISGALLGACVICGLLVVFVAMPRIRDGLQDNIESAISTEVARQMPAAADGSVAPGTYVLTAASLEESLRASGNDSTETENAIVRINSRQIEIGLDAQGQEAIYTGVPTVVNGDLDMQQMEATSRVLEFILSPDALGDAIERPVNEYLAANNLQLESVTLEEGQLRLTTIPR